MKSFLLFFLILANYQGYCQYVNDTVNTSVCKEADSVYHKPKPFSFLTDIPRDVAGFTSRSFNKKNLISLGIITVSTIGLIIIDPQVNHFIQNFSEHNNIESREDYSPLIRLKITGRETNIGKWPRNLNTAFYNIGQGSTVVLIAGGFFLKGKIKNDNRALQTSYQLLNSFIALGAGTQFIKYGSGRENPSDATSSRGVWRPFPSLNDFQNNKTKYDAFPSGHLATLIAAVTILSENYPEKKRIKSIGYAIAGLCGVAMINNGVHWISDYPLGIALGYGYGKFISKKRKHSQKLFE
ncbi:MAG: phosphatase PAP2 family protein [Ferruginibacter sp.]